MDLQPLLARIRETASSTAMAIDGEVYAVAGRDPMEPILAAGSFDSSVAFLARDLGKDEVLHGEPLIGGAGRRVRRAVYRFLIEKEPPSDDKHLSKALNHLLLTNMVPYKPLGNKPYPEAVREQFRPWISYLLCCIWSGEYVITLGTEAFMWFAPYAAGESAKEFWARKDRYEAEFSAAISADCDGKVRVRNVTVAPLPHPSPLNRAYLQQFPIMLERRLERSPLKGVRRSIMSSGGDNP